MKLLSFFIGLFTFTFCFAQETYNNCNNALEICPNMNTTVNNIGANKTFCPGCEDDFTNCFTPINSIWLKFTTNATGGDIQVALSNLIFQTQAGQDNRYNATLIKANIPCNSTSYSLTGNCIAAATGNQTITALGLPANTTYYIVLSGEKSGAGITLPAEFSITVVVSGTAIDRPVPFMNMGIDDSLCSNTLTTLMADRLNCEDPSNFFWYINGELVGETTDSLFFTTLLQNGDVVQVTSNCFTSCPVLLSQTLPPLIIQNTIADAGNDATIQPGEVVQLGGTIGINSTVIWSPSYALSDPTSRFPIANPEMTTTYSMHVTDTLTGCSATDDVTITVDKGLFLPTTFSPNGDGENDTWVILGIEAYPDCLVNIFDRWGQQVFQAVGYNKEKAWNGQGKVGKLNEGVYFYKIQLRDSEKQLMTGSITLIR